MWIFGWFDVGATGTAASAAAGGGDVSFAGTATITFSQTGDLKANAALGGTATATFGQTGALRGGAGLAGSSAITFGQTGALLSQAGFAGSTTLTFGQTGELGAASGLAGATAITFDATGDFVAGSVDTAFAGTAAITFSQTGELTSGSSFGGTIAITFDATASFIAGVGSVIADEFDTHDGKPRSATQEAYEDRYRKNKRDIQEAIRKRFYPEEPDEPESDEVIPPPIEPKPLPDEILRLLIPQAHEIIELEPQFDFSAVLRELSIMEADRIRRENDEIAIVLLLT